MQMRNLVGPRTRAVGRGLCRSVVLSLALGACGAHPAPRAAAAPSTLRGVDLDVAWDAMQRVVQGRWRAVTDDNRSISTSYRLIARGSALVETYTTTSGTETLTIFHRDGAALMLTHYCAQGNQPRLRATLATRAKIVFERIDATNVQTGQGVMQKLVFTFRPDGFDQESVYLEDGKLESTTLHFTRVAENEGSRSDNEVAVLDHGLGTRMTPSFTSSRSACGCAAVGAEIMQFPRELQVSHGSAASVQPRAPARVLLAATAASR